MKNEYQREHINENYSWVNPQSSFAVKMLAFVFDVWMASNLEWMLLLHHAAIFRYNFNHLAQSLVFFKCTYSQFNTQNSFEDWW